MVDLSNREFNDWTVIRFDKKVKTNAYWLCKCKCGKVKSVFQGNLSNGRSKRCPECGSKEKITHGLSRSRLYRYYYSVKSQAENRNEHFHWKDAEAFVKDVGLPTAGQKYLVRVNPNKGWTKKNVEWRDSYAKDNSLATIAAKLGISRQALHSRLKTGWTLQKAVSTPKTV